MRAREAAQAALLAVVVRRRSLGDALADTLPRVADARERALAQELAYGVLRRLPRLEFLVAALLDKPLRERDADVRLLLLSGAYQLLYTRVPSHAAVSETVAACDRLGKRWARGLCNAVLRRLQREREELERRADTDPVARHAHPAWLIELLRREWPEDWQGLLDAGNERPPMVLRVNLARCSRETYLQRLDGAGLTATPREHSPAALELAEAVDVARLPGFAEGLVSVQDTAAQLAAPLLGVTPGMRVLDACAAPGGKTAHLLECAAGAAVTGIDISARRLALAGDGLRRLGLQATLLEGDACDPPAWWDGRRFDRVLLDAPCSATGVIRRHPDIKLHRTSADIGALCALQSAMLDALWPLLVRGGRLLYATCSVLPAENRRQVGAFLARTGDARSLPIEASWGRDAAPGRQVLPHDERMDGFYYALLAKA